MGLDTNRAVVLAEDTMAIVARGDYDAPSGRVVALGPAIAQAVAGTHEHAPNAALAAPTARFTTALSVTDETTLGATRRLAAAGRRVAALSFGSARHPGGGFLTGAQAQEESLARSSALYACLERQPMYGYHRLHGDPMYSDRVIHAPDVPVFRDDDGQLLDAPYAVSFLTAPAVNARVVLERDPHAGPAIAKAMHGRAARVLAVAAAHGHDTLVLGAWGCGVFGNDPAVVADAFGAALEGPFQGAFAEVVFAILGAPAREVFARRFA